MVCTFAIFKEVIFSNKVISIFCKLVVGHSLAVRYAGSLFHCKRVTLCNQLSQILFIFEYVKAI